MIILGDLHGAISEIPYMLLRYGIYGKSIIQVGDFGLGFYSWENDTKNLEVLNEIMENHRCMLYIIRGNHDNPKYWEEDLEDPYLARIHGLGNIKLVKDNTLLEIDGKRVFFCGGGISIDRLARIKDANYWEDEVVHVNPTFLEEVTEVDIVVTHIAPGHAFPLGFNNFVETWIEAEKVRGRDLRSELEYERSCIDHIYNKLKDKGLSQWYYGHYHKNNVQILNGVQYCCVDIASLFDTEKSDYLVDVQGYFDNN